MTRSDADLARYRLERAFETLREAESLYDNGFTKGVVNRLYYACFYAVSSLLVMEGYSSSKHSGVMSLFDQHWVKTGRVPAELGAFYHLIFGKRNTGDYQDGSFSADDVHSWLTQALSFVQQIAAQLPDSDSNLP